MLIPVKSDCPHVENANLLPLDEFTQINFSELKCKNCQEERELLICLFCGEIFFSKNDKTHFILHNIIYTDHYLCLDIINLSIWCYECKLYNNDDINNVCNKGCYIKTTKTDEYINIYSEYKTKIEIKEKRDKENITYNEQYQKEIMERRTDLCQNIKDIKDEQWKKSPFIQGVKDFFDIKQDIIYDLICFSCGIKLHTYDELKSHTNNQHNFFIDLNELTIICMECKRKFKLIMVKDKLSIEQKIYIQAINERCPINSKFLTEEEIFECKYNELISDFSFEKYKKIVFMVGAGISTSAGIPDFRSETGLFKQLQEKYNLAKPEEFFYKTTFLKNPMFFYEFSKLFDLSQTKPTIAHKFMHFLEKKNYVKYIFTQNIDGLELKAKIPKEKLIFSHGNFTEGHCAQCDTEIDIEKINEGVNKGEVYFCPKCGGPCKPKIVFYGESLPLRFYECLFDINDADIIIIMGTSLKVHPFSSIPQRTPSNTKIVVFNNTKVGEYQYDKITSNSIFIKGKVDDNILKLLKDANKFEEFGKFIKGEYNEILSDIIGKEKQLMNVNDLEIKEKMNLD